MVDFDPCLFGVLKDDVKRCFSKDSRYTLNTESGCYFICQFQIHSLLRHLE